MVGVVVDRPVGEHGVGLLGLDDLPERLVVCRVDDRLAVELARVKRLGAEDVARFFGLRNPRGPSSLAATRPDSDRADVTSCPRSA